MKSFLGRFSKLGNLSKPFIERSVGGNKSLIIIVDDNDNPIEDVVVEIQSASGGYAYTATTDAQGEVVLRGTFGKQYTLTLNKSGVQEHTISNYTFVKQDTIIYSEATQFSNFVTSDGKYIVTSDDKIFNVKDN